MAKPNVTALDHPEVALDRETAAAAAMSLVEALGEVPDPRKARGIRHDVLTILLLGACAVLTGARSFAAIDEYAHDSGRTILDTLGVGAVVPHASTIRRVLQDVDPAAVEAAMRPTRDTRTVGHDTPCAAEIAAALGITKGRVTQIRSGAPARERAFFGVGPVHVGVPLREGTDDRMRSYVDAADLATQEDVDTLLGTLALTAEPFTIPPNTTTVPNGDTVVICGPKSAPIGAELLDTDPRLGMVRADDRWWIVDKTTGERFGSPMSVQPTGDADLGYLSRRVDGDRVIVHIAGIHSPGSRGVVHYLAHHLAELHSQAGDTSFRLAVRCTLDGLTVVNSALLTGAHVW